MTENVVDDYGWKDSSATQSDGYIAPEVISVLKRIKAHRVIDLGSGSGVLCGQLKAQGFDVVGLEYDRNGYEIACRERKPIPFYNFGVQDNPTELLKDESHFDAVVSTEVIEHLFSPHLLPAYAAAILKPGGYLVVTTPYHGYLKNLTLALFNKWDHHHNPLWHGGHVKFWSRATLSQLLEENGFKVVGFSGVGRAPYLWKSMVLIAQLHASGGA